MYSDNFGSVHDATTQTDKSEESVRYVWCFCGIAAGDETVLNY